MAALATNSIFVFEKERERKNFGLKIYENVDFITFQRKKKMWEKE